MGRSAGLIQGKKGRARFPRPLFCEVLLERNGEERAGACETFWRMQDGCLVEAVRANGFAPAFTLGFALLPFWVLMRKVIATSSAPAAVGPYSQAIAVGSTLYCAGQIPLDPVTGDMVPGGVTEQTTRVLENVGGVLKANGMDYSHVVKATVFMTDLAHFGEMNAVYGKYFQAPFPARSTIQVAALPRGAQVEIEVIAVA